MSFGFQVITDGNELLIDERFACPALVAKITLSSTPSRTSSVAGYTVYQHDFTPPASGGPFLIFWTLPTADAGIYFNFTDSVDDPYGLRSATNNTVCVIKTSTGSSYTLPEGYVFRVDAIPNSSATHGLRVFKADGTIAFDSGHRHMLLEAISSLTFPLFNGLTNWGADPETSDLPTMPSKPAFLIAPYGAERWESGTLSHGFIYDSGVRRDGSTMSARTFLTESLTEDSFISGNTYYGNTPAALPIIDAAAYD